MSMVPINHKYATQLCQDSHQFSLRTENHQDGSTTEIAQLQIHKTHLERFGLSVMVWMICDRQ